MKKIIIFILSIIIISCTDNKEKEISSICEDWTNKNVLQLYEGLNPKVIVNIEDKNSFKGDTKLLFKKYDWKGYLENDFNFSEYLELSNKMEESLYLLKANATDITEEKIKEDNFLSKQINRRVNLLESTANTESKLADGNPKLFYVKRVFIEYDNNIKDTRDIDRIDIVLDDNMNITNKIK